MDSNIPGPIVFDEYKSLVVDANRLLVLGEHANHRNVRAREINGLNRPLHLPCYAAPHAGQIEPSPNRGSVSADPCSVFGIECGRGWAIVRISDAGESFDERPDGFFIGRRRLRIGSGRESVRPSDGRQKGSPFHKTILSKCWRIDCRSVGRNCGLDEIFHHGFAQQVRRQQALRQDEVMEALDIELGAEGLLGGLANFQQAREAVKI